MKSSNWTLSTHLKMITQKISIKPNTQNERCESGQIDRTRNGFNEYSIQIKVRLNDSSRFETFLPKLSSKDFAQKNVVVRIGDGLTKPCFAV